MVSLHCAHHGFPGRHSSWAPWLHHRQTGLRVQSCSLQGEPVLPTSQAQWGPQTSAKTAVSSFSVAHTFLETM